MYRSCACILMVVLLNGCANFKGNFLSKTSPDTPEQSEPYQEEKQALFDQPYIDPLTDYLIEHQGEPARKVVLRQIRQERDQRCAAIAEKFAKEPATKAVLEDYNRGYGYSCPQQVATFKTSVEQQLAKSTPSRPPASKAKPESEPEPEPAPRTETGTAVSEAESASEKRASDQALSDCYLLTTIRNFSAAREACRGLAESGDVRSQANMAKVAYAFEEFGSAMFWAKKAAPESADAAFLLGQMYSTGRGVGQNRDLAVYWFNKAARQGHKEAQTALVQYRENSVPGNR